jgi:hypothetical protein
VRAGIDFSPDAIAARLRQRLDPAWRRDPGDDDDDDPPDPRVIERAAANPRPAAVLVPILARAPEVTLLLTERAPHLREHSGQIAFPGGKLDAGESALQAALREAQGGYRPYVHVRGGLEARLTRALYLEIVALAEVEDIAGEAMLVLRSGGAVFVIAPAAELGEAW